MKTFRYLYGPVPSRRLGRSLGVDLVPRKICTYDCVYCQIGQTTRKVALRKEYAPERKILTDVRGFLNKGIPFDHFSLAGSGEPTLNSRIRSIIGGIKSLSSIPVAVITNGSLLSDEVVREDLLSADIVLPSLDAVTPEVFARINRPLLEFSAEKVIEGMVVFRKIFKGRIWIEILFCRGVNDGESELRKMKEAVDRIEPDLIHLNTVVRPPSEKWVAPLALEEMERIRTFFGEKASIISEFNRHLDPLYGGDVQESILRILRRRPLSLVDLSKGMGLPKEQLEALMGPLIKEGKVKADLFGGTVYFEVVNS